MATDDLLATQYSAPTPRSSDSALAEYAAFAIDDLTTLISEAIRSSDDGLVARLDRVLRRIDAIVELTTGSPQDRVR